MKLTNLVIPTTHHLALPKRNAMQELFDLPMVRMGGGIFDTHPIKGGLKRRLGVANALTRKVKLQERRRTWNDCSRCLS
jgi:hypothetical protein